MGPTNRPGFSLLELTIGLLLLDVGVLALAATAAGAVRMAAAGGREGGAALVAAARLEALRASPCGPEADSPSASAGSDRAGPYLEEWSVAPDGRTARVDVTVSWVDGRAARAAPFASLLACVP
jgi:Tfp pilus assembly protein PilV